MSPISGDIPSLEQSSRTGCRREPRYYRLGRRNNFNLERFADPSNLKIAWNELRADGGQAPGNSGIGFGDFSGGDMFSVLRGIRDVLLNGSYIPKPVRTHKVDKGEGKFRILSIQEIEDRTVAKCLKQCLDPFWRARLPRLGKSAIDIFALLQRDIRQKRHFVLVVDDIKDCFPSAPMELLIQYQMVQFQCMQSLAWLVERVTRGYEGTENAIGIGQGSPYAPIAVENLLHNTLDKGFGTLHPETPLYRYVDNLNALVREIDIGQEIRKSWASMLATAGFQLKGEGKTVIDLRDTHSTKVLGLIPRWFNNQLNFEIPESAIKRLGENLETAHLNDDPQRSSKLIVTGWIRSCGPAMTKAVMNSLIPGIMDLCKSKGFFHLREDKLREIASISRRDWERRSSA